MGDFDFYPLRMQFDPDPLAIYRRGRAEHPVFFHEVPGAQRIASLFRFEDVRAVLSDADTFESIPLPGGVASLLFANGEEHKRLRGIVAKAFTPRIVQPLEPMVASLASQMVDELIERREADLVDVLSFRLAEAVMMETIGFPREDQPRIRVWSQSFAVEPQLALLWSEEDIALPPNFSEMAAEMGEYVAEIADDRRTSPRDDLLSGIVRAQQEGERLDRDEMIQMAMFFLVAGQDAVSNLIANAVRLLAGHPDQDKRLRDAPNGIPRALEEVLRYAPPFRWGEARRLTRDASFRGIDLRPGDIVIPWIESAHHDEDVFERADVFDVSRTKNPHIAFGAGRYFCVGAHLARLEGRAVLEPLLQRTRRIELAAPPVPLPSAQFIGPREMKVRVDPR